MHPHHHLKSARRLPRPLGFTLLETAIVLGVLGIVIAAIWIASASALSAQKQKRTSEAVIAIVQNIRSYVKKIDVNGLSLNTQNAIDLGLLPQDIVRGTNAVNAYGGDFNVLVTSSGISIALARLPSEACVDLIYSHFGGDTTVNDNSTTGNGAAQGMGFIGYGKGGVTLPPEIVDTSFKTVTDNCAADTNDIYMDFTL